MKDDAVLQALRHHEEAKYAKERAAASFEEAEIRRANEIQTLEARHETAMYALKRLHSDEIMAMKERSKENSALETLASQIKSSTGSMRLIEEQLNIRYKGAELIKEGQLEARERLIRDMEEKARERADSAEAEAFRLKGLLMHMEQMVTTLRSQSSEDKDRLRMEHVRLQSMQTSLENDKATFNRRMEEESESIHRKLQELQHESRRVSEERRASLKEVADDRARVEEQKIDFTNHVASSTRAVETGVGRLREEEKRLTALRADLHRERLVFEQHRETALTELREVETRGKTLALSNDDLGREKNALQQAAREVQFASENIKRRDEELERWDTELQQRESALQKRLHDVQKSSYELQRRQADIETLNNVLSTQQLALVKMDHDVLQRTTEFASSHREALRRQTSQAFESMNEESRGSTKAALVLEDIEQDFSASASNAQRKKHSSTAGSKASSTYIAREISSVEEQLALARKSLLSARSVFARN